MASCKLTADSLARFLALVQERKNITPPAAIPVKTTAVSTLVCSGFASRISLFLYSVMVLFFSQFEIAASLAKFWTTLIVSTLGSSSSTTWLFSKGVAIIGYRSTTTPFTSRLLLYWQFITRPLSIPHSWRLNP